MHLYGIGTEVQITAHCPAHVVVGHGDGTDYQVDMNAVHVNCPGHSGPCIGGWNHGSLRRVPGGGDDDGTEVLPPPIDPAEAIPLTDELDLTRLWSLVNSRSCPCRVRR